VRAIFILSAVRTPIGKCAGALRNCSAPDLGVIVARAAGGLGMALALEAA